MEYSVTKQRALFFQMTEKRGEDVYRLLLV